MLKKIIYLTPFILALSLVLTITTQANLVGWWKLDEMSGTTVADSSGTGNDGTFVGDPVWVGGIIGGAVVGTMMFVLGGGFGVQ